jgi:glycosyltransferase involved in cell wall biosynthesis
MKKKNCIIAILCFNEEKTLPILLEKILKMQKSLNYFTEIAIFDNCSSDQTAQMALNYFDVNPNMNGVVLRNEENLGYAGNVFQAILHFKKSTKDFLLIIDGDGQFPFHYAVDFLVELEKGNNLILTKRSGVTTQPVRILASIVFRIFTTLSIGTKMKDINGGFRGIDRGFLDVITGFHQGMTANPLLFFLAKKNNLKISWVRVKPEKRLAGESFLKFNKPLALSFQALKELRNIKNEEYTWKTDARN